MPWHVKKIPAIVFFLGSVTLSLVCHDHILCFNYLNALSFSYTAQLISYSTELILFGKCCIVGQDFDLPTEFLRTQAFTAGLDKHRAHRIDIGPFQIWALLNRKQRFRMKNKGSKEWKPARSAVNLIKISASDVEKIVISQSGNLLSPLCSPFNTT